MTLTASQFISRSGMTDQGLGIAGDPRRPVQFHATIKAEHLINFKLAMLSLGKIIWSEDSWDSTESLTATICDPVITVHDDRVFFEGLSKDGSAYGLVIANRECFQTTGPVTNGTTNIDFSKRLAQSFELMRRRQQHGLHIGPEGVQVHSDTGHAHYEEKIPLPTDWVRAFLQVQSAMAMPGQAIDVRPVDLLCASQFLRSNRATVAPRAMRYEFYPGADAQLVLEPWEHVIPLPGARHDYKKTKKTRVWGRRRLHLLKDVLAAADSATVYVKGRALPCFYVVSLPSISIVLGLSGWSGNPWTGTGGMDLLSGLKRAPLDVVARCEQILQDRQHASLHELRCAMNCDEATARQAVDSLCRQGRVIFDLQSQRYRDRHIFAETIDESIYFPPDPRRQEAAAIIRTGQAQIDSCEVVSLKRQGPADAKGNRPERKHQVYDIKGTVADQTCLASVDQDGAMRYGRCTCDFFTENLLNKGPCSHLIALLEASRNQWEAETHV